MARDGGPGAHDLDLTALSLLAWGERRTQANATTLTNMAAALRLLDDALPGWAEDPAFAGRQWDAGPGLSRDQPDGPPRDPRREGHPGSGTTSG
jgi:hypothetical protein